MKRITGSEQSARASGDWSPNEFYEAMARLRNDQPRRFQREISPGSQRNLENYLERKMKARLRKAA